MNRVEAKEFAMKHGYCGAASVDRLCDNCARNGIGCPHVPAVRNSVEPAKQHSWWAKARAMFSPVTVHWDVVPMSRVAPAVRQGTFESKSYLRAWIWARVWLFFNPRGAVSFKSALE